MQLVRRSRVSFAVLAAVAGVAAVLPPLASASAPAEPTEPKVLTVAQPGDIGLDNLDPRASISTVTQFVQIGVFDPLVRSVGADIVPGAAESWEVSDDGLTYTFHLRDATWSDGEPVVADDFVHAFQRLFVFSGFSQIFDPIVNGPEVRDGTVPPEELGVTAPDDSTVVIELSGPVPYFLGLASSSLSAPGRADLLEEYGDTYGADLGTFATNGPFLLDSWEHENEIVLTKNPDYWDADSISLDEVHIVVLPDTNTQRNLFDTGELDLYGIAVPLTEEEIATYGDAGQLLSYDRGGNRYLTFNNTGRGDDAKAAILSDPNFRKAISYTLDRTTFVENVLGGNGAPATVQTPPGTAVCPGTTWGEVTPNVGLYHPESPDLDAAEGYMNAVLEANGLSSVDELPSFELLTSEDPATPTLITAYVYSVLTEQMGLDVTLNQQTGSAFWESFNGLDYEIAVAGWGPDYDDPFTYLGYWISSSTDMGATFDNADYDALLDEANAETDCETRAEILGEAEALFSDIGPAIPFLHYKGTVAVQPWVTGILTSSFGVNINWVYADTAS